MYAEIPLFFIEALTSSIVPVREGAVRPIPDRGWRLILCPSRCLWSDLFRGSGSGFAHACGGMGCMVGIIFCAVWHNSSQSKAACSVVLGPRRGVQGFLLGGDVCNGSDHHQNKNQTQTKDKQTPIPQDHKPK